MKERVVNAAREPHLVLSRVQGRIESIDRLAEVESGREKPLPRWAGAPDVRAYFPEADLRVAVFFAVFFAADFFATVDRTLVFIAVFPLAFFEGVAFFAEEVVVARVAGTLRAMLFFAAAFLGAAFLLDFTGIQCTSRNGDCSRQFYAGFGYE